MVVSGLNVQYAIAFQISTCIMFAVYSLAKQVKYQYRKDNQAYGHQGELW
jgi:hypothetical protein